MTSDHIWTALEDVKDPEIPVISLVELGVIRSVVLDGDQATVTLTPTFSGCPALREMERLIVEQVEGLGFSAEVKTVLYPPWSSDDISEIGRKKLKQFGLAPPQPHGGNIVATFFDIITCPHCDSTNTTLKNSFGSTLCRAIWYCNDCQDAFEQFKPL